MIRIEPGRSPPPPFVYCNGYTIWPCRRGFVVRQWSDLRGTFATKDEAIAWCMRRGKRLNNGRR